MDTVKDKLPAGGEKKALLWLGKALAWGLPVLVLGVTLFGVVFGTMRLTWGPGLYLLLIPGLVLARLVFLLRSSRSRGSKIGRALFWNGALVLWVIFGTFFFSIFLPFEYHRIIRENAWEAFQARDNEWFSKYPPLIQDLDPGTPETVELHRCSRNAAIFETNADILLCSYGPEAYGRQKNLLARELDYRREPMTAWCFQGEETRCYEPTFRMGQDEFRFLQPPENAVSAFYKTSVLTVTNDETHEIAFIYYTDTERDGIDDMNDFLEQDCFWSFIR